MNDETQAEFEDLLSRVRELAHLGVDWHGCWNNCNRTFRRLTAGMEGDEVRECFERLIAAHSSDGDVVRPCDRTGIGVPG